MRGHESRNTSHCPSPSDLQYKTEVKLVKDQCSHPVKPSQSQTILVGLAAALFGLTGFLWQSGKNYSIHQVLKLHHWVL